MPHERKNERVESSVLIEAQNWNFAAAFVGLATIIELHKASERTKVQHIFFITVCDDPIAHKKNSFWREFFILLKMAFFSSYACKLCLWNLNERLHNTHLRGEKGRNWKLLFSAWNSMNRKSNWKRNAVHVHGSNWNKF